MFNIGRHYEGDANQHAYSSERFTIEGWRREEAMTQRTTVGKLRDALQIHWGQRHLEPLNGRGRRPLL